MLVPVISLDEENITEVPAVVTAIANLAPDMHLMGRKPLETVRVYEWMNWLSAVLHNQGFGCLLRPQRFSHEPAAFDGIKAKGLQCIEDCFGIIEENLTGI